MNIYRLFVVCALLMSTIGIASCGEDKTEQTTSSVVRPVKFIEVKDTGTLMVNRFPAVIDAGRISDLNFQVSGLIKELPAVEAKEVESGDLLAKLDQRDFRNILASAQAQFDSADSEYKRSQKLAKDKVIAENVLEQRKSQRDILKAQLDSAQKALEDTVLTAPFNGIVARVFVNPLQTVSAGEYVINLINTDVLEATVDLPASYIAQIPKNETPENTRRKAFVVLDAAPNQMIEAQFKEATLLADTASQTYAVTFSFVPPPNLTILPGMNATMELRRHNTHNGSLRVAVPLAAILSDGADTYVWVVDKETMHVNKQSVVLEEGVGETVVVTGGLAPGQMIVGAGATYLSEGMQVREWKN